MAGLLQRIGKDRAVARLTAAASASIPESAPETNSPIAAGEDMM